jgi:outer membrane protein OmpA-like peptidoglycan-associated protein
MRRARPLVIPCVLVGALTIACGPRRVAAPAAPAPAVVVLLPDADGKVGRVRVFNEFGSAELTSERQAVNASADRRPGAVTTMSEADVKRAFGTALAALPQPPRYFTLYFQFESDRLTEQSRALLPEILKTVRERSMPEVTVVGHTDTMGSSDANIQLGLKRASTVRKILVEAGLDPALVDVTSHGEADLLMRTPDRTAELHNRRVEISVR